MAKFRENKKAEGPFAARSCFLALKLDDFHDLVFFFVPLGEDTNPIFDGAPTQVGFS